MKVGVFSIFDSKAEAYLQPFFSPNAGTATRALHQVVNDPSSNFCKFPADYTLFEIGSYNDATGDLDKLDVHTNLGNVVTIKAQGENNNGPE